MRAKIGSVGLVMTLAACFAAAQEPAKAPNPSDIYCSGMVTNAPVPRDTYLISGEQSNHKITFTQGDLVYINKGSSQGAKVGDEFLVLRPVKERLRFVWFRWQSSLMREMGKQWADLGRLRVINVQANASIAEIIFSCDYMQRGDVVHAFAERPSPPLKLNAKFDRFAPASGRPAGMVVTTKNFGQAGGANTVVYVNLGSAQGVKVGDYFRIFRYQGTRFEIPFQTYGTAYTVYGFGRAPRRYKWNNLPREILGEGIVLRVSPNASTVLLTVGLREIYVGDFVEIE